MSLDPNISQLTKLGKVTIEAHPTKGVEIRIEDFEAENCTCRDLAVQACNWAIIELAKEMAESIERPGRSNAIVD
jgi:hypothetical protein